MLIAYLTIYVTLCRDCAVGFASLCLPWQWWIGGYQSLDEVVSQLLSVVVQGRQPNPGANMEWIVEIRDAKGEWVDSGEGPFFSEADALEFAAIECGVEYQVHARGTLAQWNNVA